MRGAPTSGGPTGDDASGDRLPPHAWHKLTRFAASRLLRLNSDPASLPVAPRGALAPVLAYLALLDLSPIRADRSGRSIVAIPLRELAARTGVHRTKLPHALRVLEGAGLLERLDPGRRAGNDPLAFALLGPGTRGGGLDQPADPATTPTPRTDPGDDRPNTEHQPNGSFANPSGKALAPGLPRFAKVSRKALAPGLTGWSLLGYHLSRNSERKPLPFPIPPTPETGPRDVKKCIHTSPSGAGDARTRDSDPRTPSVGPEWRAVRELAVALGATPGQAGLYASAVSLDVARSLVDAGRSRGEPADRTLDRLRKLALDSVVGPKGTRPDRRGSR